MAALFTFAAAACPAALASDFFVTSPGSYYSFNGTGRNPTITLVRGRTYTFSISTASNHPFEIATSFGGPAPSGISGNNNSSSGTITFDVPLNAPNCIYWCPLHSFGGTILMTDPPAPPTVTLVNIRAGTNIVLTSTQLTTNGFAFIPEVSTNLLATNWTALTINSNRFANGTNEIFCGRPPSTNAFFRIRIQ